jgi:hypothetical protein
VIVVLILGTVVTLVTLLVSGMTEVSRTEAKEFPTEFKSAA